jgi:TonB-dependent SusC/RagA subfamily outer membrane receptor
MKNLNIILTLAAAMTFSSLTCLPEASAQTSDPIETTNLTDAGAYLQGKFSGLLVMNPSGAPGETAKLRVRGFTSSNGNGGPLLIVDGLKVENIQHIDPSMIESVEVLKDGAATALYGVQGGNGVILITTKKGSGKFSVSYDFKMTSSSLGRRADLMNAEEWLQNKKESYGDYIDFSKYTADTDWQDFAYGNGFAHQHGLNLQAGNDKGGFFAAFNYLDNNGIVKGSADTHRRIAGQANGNYKFTDWLEVGLNASFATQDIFYVNQQNEYGYMFSAINRAIPAMEPYTSEPSGNKNALKDPSNGKYYASEGFNVHPFVYRDLIQNHAIQKDLNGIMYARLTPFDGFAFTARVGYRMEQQDRRSDAVPFYASETTFSNLYSLAVTERSNNGYQADALAEYTLVKGKHNLGFKAGAYYESVTHTYRDGSSTSESKALEYDDINISTNEDETSDLGFLAQAGYSYAGRYNIQAGIRTDKYTSVRLIGKIYEEKPWNLYPAVSAGWTISNESFFSGVNPSAISHLELKASWGKGGSTRDLEAFWNPMTAVQIETSQQMNVGAEASMLKGRLGIAVDWFDKDTESFPFNPSTLTSSTEAGSVENKGIEIDLIWKDKIGDFGYSIAGNFSTLKNTVTSLGIEAISRIMGTNMYNKVNTAYSVGMPMFYFYGYPEGTEEWREDNKDYIGQGIPTSYFGLSINMNYKGFDLNISGNGTAGNSIAYCMYDPSKVTFNAIKDFSAKEWTPQNASVMNQSDAVVFNGSYFRIRQLQLGYTIPSNITRKIFMQNARVFVSLDDWFTFSKYPGGDPETATTGSGLTNRIASNVDYRPSITGSDMAIGMDHGSYPMSKKVVFGLSIRF